MDDDSRDESYRSVTERYQRGEIPGITLLRLAAAGFDVDDPDFDLRADTVAKVLDASRVGIKPEPSPPPLRERSGVVYYMQIRDTIKIGFTTQSVRKRQEQLRADRILAIEPGDQYVEKYSAGRVHPVAHRRIGQGEVRASPRTPGPHLPSAARAPRVEPRAHRCDTPWTGRHWKPTARDGTLGAVAQLSQSPRSPCRVETGRGFGIQQPDPAAHTTNATSIAASLPRMGTRSHRTTW